MLVEHVIGFISVSTSQALVNNHIQAADQRL